MNHHKISRSLLHFIGKGKSSLKNVRIRTEHDYEAENVSQSTFAFSRAVVCDGGCPKVTNLNITGFAVAFEIPNYGEVFVGNINVMNCFYGVVAFHNEKIGTGSKTWSKRFQEMFRLEKITVENSHVAFVLENHFSFPMELKEIVIKNTTYGIHISKSMFTKVKMSDLIFDTGFNAITTQTTTPPTGYFEHVGACDDNYNSTLSFPVEIIANSTHRNCSMVSLGFFISRYLSL